MFGKLLDRFRQKGPSRPRPKAEMEKRRRVLIVLLIVLAVISAAGILGYGYYDTNVKPWHEPILKVNGTVFDMRYFVGMMRINGVNTSSYVSYVIDAMEDNELKKQYLQSEFPNVDIGAVTSDAAVEAKLRSLLVSDNATGEEYQAAYKQMQDNLKSVGLSIGDFEKLYIKPQLISEELQKQVGDRDYPATDNYEHAQVQALLVKATTDNVTALENANRLRALWEGGEAFDTLTSDNAVSTSIKDIGTDNMTNWVAKGIKSEAFDNYTFTMGLDSGVSEPIEDNESTNYWLIKVLARESRPLSETDRDTLVSKAIDAWLEDAKNSGEYPIINYLEQKNGPAKLTWALAHV